MTHIPRPGVRPADSRFSSGPTKKRPGWNLQALEGALLGRSHRSKPGKAKLKEAIDRTRALLAVPAIGFTASDVNLVSAVLVAIALYLPGRKIKLFKLLPRRAP